MRYRLLFLLCLAAVIAYVQRAALSVPLARIAGDLSVTNIAGDMGWVQSAWYLGYASMQIPSGWLADRYGSRLALAMYCTAWSVMTLLSGFATSYWSLLITWGLMGCAQAGIFPCATKAVAQTFPDSERARASGMLSFGMYAGTALGPLITGLLLNYFTWPGPTDWRACLTLFAIPGLLWSLAFLESISSRDLPLQTTTGPAERVDWARLLSSPPLVLLFVQQFLRAGAMVFFITWFPMYLQRARGVSVGNSGVLTFYAAVGGMLGSLLGGFVSDAILKYTGNRRLSRQGIAIAGTGSCAVLALLSYFIEDKNLAIAVISLGAFCATFGGVSAYTMAIELGGKQVTTVFAAMNMFGNIGAMLFPVTVGWLVSTTGNWNLALFLFASIMAVAALCWIKLNPQQLPGKNPS